MIALVVRTRRPFFRSRPGNTLLLLTVALLVVTPAIPFLPFVGELGFVPIPAALIAVLLGITAAYVLATEILKRQFYRERA